VSDDGLLRHIEDLEARLDKALRDAHKENQGAIALSRQLATIEDERDAVKRQLADARAILSDLLAERGESWVAQLVGRREDVMTALRAGLHADPGLPGGGRCVVCGCYWDSAHDRDCHLATGLRIVGGSEETQRQVDGAHGAASQFTYDDTTRMLRAPSTVTKPKARIKLP
jgi:hypothetical protein